MSTLYLNPTGIIKTVKTCLTTSTTDCGKSNPAAVTPAAVKYHFFGCEVPSDPNQLQAVSDEEFMLIEVVVSVVPREVTTRHLCFWNTQSYKNARHAPKRLHHARHCRNRRLSPEYISSVIGYISDVGDDDWHIYVLFELIACCMFSVSTSFNQFQLSTAWLMISYYTCSSTNNCSIYYIIAAVETLESRVSEHWRRTQTIRGCPRPSLSSVVG